VPRITANTGARILERLELESIARQSNCPSVYEEEVTVGGHEVRHRATAVHMTMEPEAAVHREDHSVSTLGELAERRRLCHFVAHQTARRFLKAT